MPRTATFSLSFLFLVTALWAATLVVFRGFGWDTGSLLILVVLWSVTGYLAGWIASNFHSVFARSTVPAAALVVFSWLLWYVNRLSLSYASNTDHETAEVLSRMVFAEQYRFFDAVAVMFTVLIGIAVWKSEKRLLSHVGLACLVTWFTVVVIGYVVACASL